MKELEAKLHHERMDGTFQREMLQYLIQDKVDIEIDQSLLSTGMYDDDEDDDDDDDEEEGKRFVKQIMFHIHWPLYELVQNLEDVCMYDI